MSGITSPEHHAKAMRNLDKAQRVRIEHARTKRWIAQAASTEESRHRAAGVVMDPPGRTGSMRVRDLLEACRWIRKERSRQALLRVRIDGALTLSRLDLAERVRLHNELVGQHEQLELGAAG